MPALESLDTVNIVTSSFDAEQGLAGGSAINAQIKSGTNNFTDRRSTTRTNSCGRRTTSRHPVRRRLAVRSNAAVRWAAPIVHNKLFSSELRGHARPAVAEPHALGSDRGAAPRRPVRLADADLRSITGSERLGRTAVAGNIIPAERIDPTARQLLALLPLPNLATTETNNYFVQAPFVLNRWTLDTKVNWSANELNLFGRFSVLDFFTENGTNFGRELQDSRSARATPAPEAGTPITCRPARPT